MRVSMASSYADKIALFRQRFACRSDVWSRRWTSARTGRSGWAAACGNEWRPGFCPKPARGCAGCRCRAWLPLTDEIARWHLLGATPSGKPFALGGHPILPGDDCRFAAVAVPERREASAALRAATRLGAAAAVSSSLAGDGFILWWFFASPVPSAVARALVSACLTAARRSDGPIPFPEWDRIVPEQAAIPATGPGEPVPLPLPGEARRRGRGVFLDPETLAPLDDPWIALSETPVLAPETAERIVEAARGAIWPVAAVDRDACTLPAVPFRPRETRHASTVPVPGPDLRKFEISDLPPGAHDQQSGTRDLPPGNCAPCRFRVSAVLSDRLRMPLAELPPGAAARLEETAAFLSPVFDDAERMRRPVRGIPRIESHARTEDGVLFLPRGALDAARAALRRCGVALRIRDERESGDALDVSFRGELRPAQRAAAEAMLRHDCGVLEAGTAFGKTVLAAWMIAFRGRAALVLVNRRTLQRQWIARLSQFLGLREREIGRIGGGSRRATGRLDVALLQTLARRSSAELRALRYGFVVVDECHALPASTFARVADCLRARFVLGLSATPVRRDGRQAALALQCGPVRHSVPASALARTEPFSHIAIIRPTEFAEPPGIAPKTPGAPAFSALCTALCDNADRNARIADDAMACVADGRSPVILTDRRTHVSVLAAELRRRGAENVFELVGGLGPKALAATTADIAAVPPDQGRVLVATGPLLGEGFDDARLDTLLLATPLSWRGRLAQYAGRLHRRFEGKKEVRIYDYADLAVPALSRMFDKRVEAYAAIGYDVRFPVNAVAGWPASVPVPIDPLWNDTYGESARRLCADRADAQLAELFVHAAWTRPPDGLEEILRARSAAEAFLFRRLGTLPATRGRFALNAALPIPFRNALSLEVDLLCRDARLAIELDGPQHLSEKAYRRDREKDLVLQTHGWTVLRFLASDATARLPFVLDTILSVLSRA